MSKLQDLIQTLCPNGVEWKKLGEVVKIMNGKDYKNLTIGNVPVYGSGGIMTYVNQYVYDKPSVLLPRKGSLKNIFYVDIPFWTVDTIYWTRINNDSISPKFFYYFMQTKDIESMNISNGGAVPSMTQAQYNKIEIPIPPLPVQDEIVKILDRFTAYAAELQAELQARQEQYEYYRNRLLSFGEFKGLDNIYCETIDNQEITPPVCRFQKMSEIGTFTRGNGLQKRDFVESGVPCIHYGQIYTYYGTFATKTKSFVSRQTADRCKKAHTNDLIFATVSENIEDVCKCVAWLGDGEICISGDSLAFCHNQNPKYLAYYFQTTAFADYKRTKVTGTKVIRLHQSKLEQFVIPVPSLVEQERIVSVLDKFEALVNDILQGLPAEIAAVQEQYEYYRNKLLSFPKNKTSA